MFCVKWSNACTFHKLFYISWPKTNDSRYTRTNIWYRSRFLNIQVDVTQVSREDDDESSLHLCKLDVRQPRLRRVRSGRVTSYPVIAQFEDQLSKPFYFRQRDHGPVLDVLFPKSTESPQVAALKKGKITNSQCTGSDKPRVKSPFTSPRAHSWFRGNVFRKKMILWPLLGENWIEMDCYRKLSLKNPSGLFIYFLGGWGGGGGVWWKVLKKNCWQKHETRNTLSASKKKAVLREIYFPVYRNTKRVSYNILNVSPVIR